MALGIGAAVAAACAAIVVPAILPGSTLTSFVTKAWAVQRNADGTVTMRIAQFAFDGAGLQQALPAGGVPALVRFRVVNDPSYQVGDAGNAPGVPAGRQQPGTGRGPSRCHQPAQNSRTARLGGRVRHSSLGHAAGIGAAALIHTGSPRPSGAFTTWVLKQDRLPACAG